MGYAKWSSSDYANLRARYAHQSRDEIFRNNRLHRIAPEMNPFGLGIRESRDSEAHPNSLAIAVFLDVTGSMGRIPELLIRHKLGTLMDTLLDHHIEDPQVLFAAIGDQFTDRAPLQVGQFESGALEMNHCLSQIYLEGGGGGQARESYQLAWLIGGRHTAIDCYEKRRQKGFLFTVGDEMSWDTIDGPFLQSIMGYRESGMISAQEALQEAQRMYHVFHIHINETGYRNHRGILQGWQQLLGDHFLVLDDHSLLAELIAAVIALQHGVVFEDLSSNFAQGNRSVIKGALGNLPANLNRRNRNSILPL